MAYILPLASRRAYQFCARVGLRIGRLCLYVWLSRTDLSVTNVYRCAGASDSTFHVMWVILFNAVDDFGVRELIMHHRMGSPQDQASYQMQMRAEEVMRTILDEGLHGALRIAGLAGVLTKNGYLVRSIHLSYGPS
jgi:hypothetical protein